MTSKKRELVDRQKILMGFKFISMVTSYKNTNST